MEDNKNKHIKIMDIDPYLRPYERDINLRMDSYTSSKKKLLGMIKTLNLLQMVNYIMGFI